MKNNRAKKTGFTLIELLVVMAIIALLLGILLPALNKARAKARQVKSATQLSQIHKGMITFASDEDGIFPTPGLIARKEYNGAFVPGKGDEDYLANNHANVYSAIMNDTLIEKVSVTWQYLLTFAFIMIPILIFPRLGPTVLSSTNFIS